MKQPNQLNELMIVNPGIPGNEEVLGTVGSFLGEVGFLYLGDDGTFYRPVFSGAFPDSATFGEAEIDETAIGRYFLGEELLLPNIAN